MGQFSVTIPTAAGSVLGDSQHYRITHRSGPRTLVCGSERTGYVSFWQHAPGELVLNVFWDRDVPPNHPKQEPTQALPDRCIMSFYAR